jgi:TonB-dependent SusC/RagA subfamily outer membrane receptor
MSTTGMPGGEDPQIIIRGRSTWNGGEPLVLVDGVPGSLDDVPIAVVERIDILKEASQTAIYGARGANGVVLITTIKATSGR